MVCQISFCPYQTIYIAWLFSLNASRVPVFMDQCEDSYCTTKSYVAKTNILTTERGNYADGFKDIIASRKDVEQAQRDIPGLVDISVGKVRHDIVPGKFFLVEKWETADDVNDDLLTLFESTSVDNAERQGSWQTHDLVDVGSAFCPAKKIGNISMKLKHGCRSVWKAVGSPGYCAWVPGCMFMHQSGTFSNAKLYMDNGSVLDAIVEKDSKARKIQLSALSNERLSGYFGAITLERAGFGSCEIKYHYRHAIKDAVESESYFHELFVPDLYENLGK